MCSRYSGDHTAEDHIHTDITTCYTEEPHQKYAVGTVGKRLPAELKHLYLHVVHCIFTINLIKIYLLKWQQATVPHESSSFELLKRKR